jgi:dolichol-phosphate mannosyltransferase
LDVDLSTNMKVLIIIPTFNEKESIADLISAIRQSHVPADIVIVDDNSPDGTAEIVQTLAAIDQTIKLIKRTERGLGTAYAAGFSFGLQRDYDLFITMDADFSHDPKYLPQILSAASHCDVVIGSRYIRDGGTINWSIRRILLSWLANKFAHILLKLQSSDLTSGFRAYRRPILQKIPFSTFRSQGYSFLVEMLFWAKNKDAAIVEIPIIFFDRRLGKSKISKREIYRGAWTLIRLRLSNWHHLER